MQDLPALMLAAGQGDKNAFTELARAVSGGAHRFAYQLTQNQAAADDVVQNMLIKLWRYAPRWEPTGSVIGYVRRLTYTCAMDYLRKKKPEVDVESIVEMGEPETVTKQIADKQTHKEIALAMESLPERQRTALVLTYLQEMPQADVAEMMGTSVKAVESLLIRGKRTLKGLLPETLLEKAA